MSEVVFSTDDPDPLADIDLNALTVSGDLCGSDLDGSGDVDTEDILSLLAAWGPCRPGPKCQADLDASGAVAFRDLLGLLSTWGECP